MQNEAPKAISPASWLAAALISSIVSSAVIIDGVSGLFAASNPELALRLNPLRSDERIAVVLERIGDAGAREVVETGLRLSPIDGRFYSLMGILAEHEGDQKGASRFYKYALDLLPTEIQALTRQLAIDIDERQFGDAAVRLELVARRWPEYWTTIEPALTSLLSTEESYIHIRQSFQEHPPIRRMLIRSLSLNPETLPFAYRLVLDWVDSNASDMEGVINQVTSAFLRQKQYAEAYLFFQLTRSEERRSGFVYNGSFDWPLSGSPFDWQIRDQAGVSLKLIQTGNESALSVRFLDNPIQFRNVSQLVRMVPGLYAITVDYEGRSLITPKPLQMGIRCIPSNDALLTAPMSDGTGVHNDTSDFIVPANDCALQEIFVFNERMPMSWQNRYRGTLLVKAVSVRRGSSR